MGQLELVGETTGAQVKEQVCADFRSRGSLEPYREFLRLYLLREAAREEPPATVDVAWSGGPKSRSTHRWYAVQFLKKGISPSMIRQ